MEISSSWADSIMVLQLKGRLDTNAALEFEQQVDEAVRFSKNKLIFDFSELEYICSSGLRVIIQAAKKIGSLDGKLVLCAMEDYIYEVFEISGFDAFLTIVGSKNDALGSFS